jgi:hypothetical protein
MNTSTLLGPGAAVDEPAVGCGDRVRCCAGDREWRGEDVVRLGEADGPAVGADEPAPEQPASRVDTARATSAGIDLFIHPSRVSVRPD